MAREGRLTRLRGALAELIEPPRKRAGPLRATAHPTAQSLLDRLGRLDRWIEAYLVGDDVVALYLQTEVELYELDPEERAATALLLDHLRRRLCERLGAIGVTVDVATPVERATRAMEERRVNTEDEVGGPDGEAAPRGGPGAGPGEVN